MDMSPRWTNGSTRPQGGEHRPEPTPESRPDGTLPTPGSGYSLQGEEDLFRDPFADFAPSSR